MTGRDPTYSPARPERDDDSHARQEEGDRIYALFRKVRGLLAAIPDDIDNEARIRWLMSVTGLRWLDARDALAEHEIERARAAG